MKFYIEITQKYHISPLKTYPCSDSRLVNMFTKITVEVIWLNMISNSVKIETIFSSKDTILALINQFFGRSPNLV